MFAPHRIGRRRPSNQYSPKQQGNSLLLGWHRLLRVSSALLVAARVQGFAPQELLSRQYAVVTPLGLVYSSWCGYASGQNPWPCSAMAVTATKAASIARSARCRACAPRPILFISTRAALRAASRAARALLLPFAGFAGRRVWAPAASPKRFAHNMTALRAARRRAISGFACTRP